jgi:hypothetical protein
MAHHHILYFISQSGRALWETGQPDFRRNAKTLAAEEVARLATQNAWRIHQSEE